MNSESGGLNMKDDEIEDVLMKVIENDADFMTPNVMSPDKMWNGGIGQSMAGTPTDFRRESIRSSLSMMKAKLLGGQLIGRSSTSIGNTKDDFWDGMANPALTRSGEDLSDLGSTLNSTAHGAPAAEKEGPTSLPLNSVKKELQRDISDPTNRAALPNIDGRIPHITEPVGNPATVISVRGSGGGSGGQDDDRTSVLHSEHPVS